MTSQISTYSGNIDASFPVAGKDNDSVGFRDNFASIKSAFTEATTEVSALQAVVVTTADLATQTMPVTNNFQSSVISNAGYSQLNGVFYGPNTHISGTSNYIDLAHGPMQKFILSGNATLTFTGWPSNSSYLNATYASVRVMLYGDQQGSYTVTLSTTPAGTLRTATGWTGGTNPVTLTVGNTANYEVIEAWSVDGGVTVFVKSIGEY